jgi:hypothetical protein
VGVARGTSKLLLDEQPLQVLPTLAVSLGLNRAMFVQQLHYWLQKPSAHVREDEEGVERRWVYNTFEGWHEQFPFWTSEAIRKIVTPLVAKGIVVATDHFNERKGDRTKWYSIDYAALNELLDGGEEASEAAPENRPQAQKHPDKSTEQPENPPVLEPDKFTERYQREPETNNRDSVLQTGDRPKGDGPPKPVSTKSYGIQRLMELVNEAKAGGKKPAPPDEPYKRRHGDVYAAHLSDGREADELEPALRYLVKVACGEGPGWLLGKKRWIPLVDAIAHAESGYEGTVLGRGDAEPVNPHSERGSKARSKARPAFWYASAYEAPYEVIEELLARGLNHDEMCRELDRGASSGAA